MQIGIEINKKMYSQNYPVVDNVVYPQQQQQQQQFQQRLQSPMHPTMMQHQQPIPLQHKKEPLPSATDAKPNITLSISEIAEFSSTMVYLMWHARRQSVMDLHSSSKSDITLQNNSSLEQTRVTADMANMTSAAFKKFCRQILSATQLSESVVLLSLKYIAMLLQNNPNIQGADGSEYRLFTVALMLANKFLDDNTFTNKTWSEVSGMKVIDLNIMELEFLDVLRFKLSVQKEEYERWRTALFGFRSQLMGVPVEIQRQKLMETMALSVGNTQQPWSQQQQQYKHHQVQQQQQQQQQQVQQQQQQQKAQQQQHAAAVAAVTHNFFLFSKAQQQYPVQPTFNGPLTRVPLRIPAQPVYHNIRTTPSAPPNVLTPINVYDNRSNVVAPSSATATGGGGVNSSSSNSSRRPAAETGYAPYQKQPPQNTPQPRIVASNAIIPSISSAASSSSNTPIYPQQALPPQQQQKPSPFGTPISNQQPFTRSYPSASVTNSNNVAPVSQHHQHHHHHPQHQTPSTSSNGSSASTRASHRTSSLPPSGGLEMNVKNSSYYYATPSATPTNIAYSSTNTNSTNNYPSATTSYYVDPATSMTTPVAAMAMSPADYNPYNTANTHTSPAGMTDVYNRPMVPRSTSYKNVPPQQHPQHQLPVTPNGHYMQQHDVYPPPQLQPPLQQQQAAAYNGPTPEDPLTVIDSYRAHRH